MGPQAQPAPALVRRRGGHSETEPQEPALQQQCEPHKRALESPPSVPSLPGIGQLLLLLATFTFCSLPTSQTRHRAGRSQQAAVEEGDQSRSPHASALRGCRGAPVEFRWLLHDGVVAPEGASPAHAVAGSQLRTRVLAYDQHGRLAVASTCGDVRVKVYLGGSARLSSETSSLKWANGELLLDIENQVAELVQVQLQLQSPSRAANTTMRSLRIRFVPGSTVRLDFGVRPLSHTSARRAQLVANASAVAWPTQLVHEVVLSGRDSLDNRIPGSAILDGFGARLTGSGEVDILGKGAFTLDKDGEARVLIRSQRAGTAQLRLEPVGSLALPREVFDSASRQLLFQGPPPTGAAAIGSSRLSPQDAEWRGLAEEVRGAFLHAWRGYKQYAWGSDELQPLSKQGRNSFGKIGMTILDSLTTLHLMGLHEEFEAGVDFVEKHLAFDSVDLEVSVFELIIRAVGGLLGAHSLSGRPVLLRRAVELADRLLPALNTSSGLPLPKWNLRRGSAAPSTEPTILAEAGSLQLEFRHLAAVTGDRRYSRAADAVFEAIQATGVIGLVPVQLTPPEHFPPQALATKFAVGALADSYYEYLLKQWLQSPSEERFKEMWLTVMRELPVLVRPTPTSDAPRGAPAPKFKLMELTPNGAAIAKMDHLSCFVPGMIALGLMNLPASDLGEGRNASWLHLAEGLTSSCTELWTSMKSGLAPEYVLLAHRSPFAIRDVPQGARHSFLRPETVESLFYLHRLTGKEKYRRWGADLFRSIMEHSKVEAGFASVADVNKVPTDKLDDMQSFVMAETFKYLYLLFSPREALDLESYILNTEAHPLRKPGPISV